MLPLEVDLLDGRPVPLYQQVANRARRLKELGMSNRTIGRVLGVRHGVIAMALDWTSSGSAATSDAKCPS